MGTPERLRISRCEFKLRVSVLSRPELAVKQERVKRRYLNEGREKRLLTDRSALPRKIACGGVCGGPEGALHQMLCEFKMALDKAIRQIAAGSLPFP